jgi:hypothetical protein
MEGMHIVFPGNHQKKKKKKTDAVELEHHFSVLSMNTGFLEADKIEQKLKSCPKLCGQILKILLEVFDSMSPRLA